MSEESHGLPFLINIKTNHDEDRPALLTLCTLIVKGSEVTGVTVKD